MSNNTNTRTPGPLRFQDFEEAGLQDFLTEPEGEDIEEEDFFDNESKEFEDKRKGAGKRKKIKKHHSKKHSRKSRRKSRRVSRKYHRTMRRSISLSRYRR